MPEGTDLSVTLTLQPKVTHRLCTNHVKYTTTNNITFTPSLVLTVLGLHYNFALQISHTLVHVE